MRRFASIVVISLLLTAAAPVMACLTSVMMSHEESACCREMQGNAAIWRRWVAAERKPTTDQKPQTGDPCPV